MEMIISVLISATAFYFGAKLLDGVSVKNFGEAIIVALVIGLLNVTLGFVLKIVTLGILSLGVFTLLLDAILIQVADYFLKGFQVKNFWWALGLAAVVAIFDGFIGWLL